MEEGCGGVGVGERVGRVRRKVGTARVGLEMTVGVGVMKFSVLTSVVESRECW